MFELLFYSIKNLRSEATSLFDVQRWTFDVGRSLKVNVYDVIFLMPIGLIR
jgi:hypothetical protein